jgi:hypothetical protein
MRIESKARRNRPVPGGYVQGETGVPSFALLVRLFGDRQSMRENFDQVCSPISLLNFEPFVSTMRPIGLRRATQPAPQGKGETKRQQKAYYLGAGGELLTGSNTEGPGR